MKREIVTLIGSSRFLEAHAQAMKRETLAGRICIGMGLFGHNEPGFDMDGPVKQMLDELHLDKIRLADTVFVVNEMEYRCSLCKSFYEASGKSNCKCNAMTETAPYIGASTRRELAFARDAGKNIRWLMPCAEALPGETL